MADIEQFTPKPAPDVQARVDALAADLQRDRPDLTTEVIELALTRLFDQKGRIACPDRRGHGQYSRIPDSAVIVPLSLPI